MTTEPAAARPHAAEPAKVRGVLLRASTGEVFFVEGGLRAFKLDLGKDNLAGYARGATDRGPVDADDAAWGPLAKLVEYEKAFRDADGAANPGGASHEANAGPFLLQMLNAEVEVDDLGDIVFAGSGGQVDELGSLPAGSGGQPDPAGAAVQVSSGGQPDPAGAAVQVSSGGQPDPAGAAVQVSSGGQPDAAEATLKSGSGGQPSPA